MNNEYSRVGLYDHNAESYKKVSDAFNEEDVVAIVHATGTGKSYNALQLAYDNKDKKIVYVVPSHGIIEHIKKIINNNPNLSFERDFSNIEFRTYQSFISMDTDEISEIDVDMLILDEFHHIGAPVWGTRINSLIETHPDIKVFGMTAYTVRDRGTSYERDMANPDTNELFSNKVVSRYDLCDAMIDGVLPKPIYKSAYVNLIGTERILEEKVRALDATSKEYQEYMAILTDVKKRIQEAPSISDVVKRNIKPNGKYIYFCPPSSEEGINDINTIMSEAKKWFLDMGLSEEDIILYSTTSDMGIEGKNNRDAFYSDVDADGRSVDGKLRVMFAINQYNEGIHAPNVDGVIMGRGTTSDIVYFEQLGRALSVRGETKEKFDEYEKYSVEELLEICKKRDIPIKDGTPKEEIIEKLLAPIIIDLTNNFDFIRELENNLRDRIKDIQARGLGNKRIIKIRDASFDIEITNQDLFEMLRYVSDRLTMTWEDKYEYAKAYYERNGNLEIPHSFKTSNGYDYNENGTINLGHWISYQRDIFESLSDEKKFKLEQIGFIPNKYDYQWQKKYELAKKYYEYHKNLNVPKKFKTINGYEPDENGINLGNWITVQRRNSEKIPFERKQMLEQIGFVINVLDSQWERMYELAEIYYEHHKNSLINGTYKTINGYEPDKNGVNLGAWIIAQRGKYDSLSDERKAKLAKIDFVVNANDYQWHKYYALAKVYFEKYGNLEISSKFKTINGYEPDENGINLGIWVHTQKSRYDKLSNERKQMLEQIGCFTSVFDNKWERMYELAKVYFEKYGNLEISSRFKTINGYEPDENGISLGAWIVVQRRNFNTLDDDKKQKLLSIGMRLEYKKVFKSWEEMFEIAKDFYILHNHLHISQKFVTKEGVRLGSWIANQRNLTSPDSEKGQLLSSIGMIWNTKKNKEEIVDVCLIYNIDFNKNKTILEHISIQELKSKIEFLRGNNIPLVDTQGKLHKIFAMSSTNMQVKYGVSLEELINKYYVTSMKKGGI